MVNSGGFQDAGDWGHDGCMIALGKSTDTFLTGWCWHMGRDHEHRGGQTLCAAGLGLACQAPGAIFILQHVDIIVPGNIKEGIYIITHTT